MAKPVANLRLFVAIHPPEAVAQAMLRGIEGRDLPDHKNTPVDQVHLTLQFIGDTPAKELEGTMESVRRAASGLPAFDLWPLRLITLPERGPARLIAVESDSPATLLELHRRLVQRLAGNMRERNRERFRPHMTICRFRTPARGFSLDEEVSIGAFPVREIRMMRSTLAPDGALHHEVATVPFG